MKFKIRSNVHIVNFLS